jgi:hypothetical protein
MIKINLQLGLSQTSQLFLAGRPLAGYTQVVAEAPLTFRQKGYQPGECGTPVVVGNYYTKPKPWPNFALHFLCQGLPD